MTVGRKSAYFKELKDSQLFDQLIGKYKGLKSDPQPTILTHKEIVQHHVTDLDRLIHARVPPPRFGGTG